MKNPSEPDFPPWQASLALAQSHANSARFPEMLLTCQHITQAHSTELAAWLDVGSLLLNHGYLTQARDCFAQAQLLSPQDPRAQTNLANVARDSGDHVEAQRIYTALQAVQPNTAVIRRNLLVSQEYAPQVTDHQRLTQARAWGDWAIAQTGSWRPRPPMRALSGRPLRVGYVSADLCQHTVGLFVKDVLQAHTVVVFAYSAGLVQDWVSKAIGTA